LMPTFTAMCGSFPFSSLWKHLQSSVLRPAVNHVPPAPRRIANLAAPPIAVNSLLSDCLVAHEDDSEAIAAAAAKFCLKALGIAADGVYGA